MARKSTGSGTTITCVVSGKSRATTWPYLKAKAERLGTNCKDLKKFYICREVVTQLNKGTDISDLIVDTMKEDFDKLLQEKSVDEMVALNSRAKKNKEKKAPKANRFAENENEADADIDLTLVDTAEPQPEPVPVEEPLSPETEQYLATKAELLGGQEVVDEIHNRVWGEEEVEEEVMA